MVQCLYPVSTTKCELLLHKRRPNVAFCASDISCIRKMGLCFKIYDTPYWTEASSLTHPSIQPPESASNAHHVLMNMINFCAGSLWTPFSPLPPPKKKTSNHCFRSSNVLTSIKATPAFLYKQKQNNSRSLEPHKQTAEQHSSEQSTTPQRLKGRQTMCSLLNQTPSELLCSSDFILFSHLHFFYDVFKNAGKKLKFISPVYSHIFESISHRTFAPF